MSNYYENEDQEEIEEDYDEEQEENKDQIIITGQNRLR